MDIDGTKSQQTNGSIEVAYFLNELERIYESVKLLLKDAREENRQKWGDVRRRDMTSGALFEKDWMCESKTSETWRSVRDVIEESEKLPKLISWAHEKV